MSFERNVAREYINVWKKPFDYNGSVKRFRYWNFIISTQIIFLCINIIQSIANQSISVFFMSEAGVLSVAIVTALQIVSQSIQILSLLFIFGTLYLTLPVTIGRLRDIGKSPVWVIVLIVPVVGFILSLFWLTKPTKLVGEGVVNLI